MRTKPIPFAVLAAGIGLAAALLAAPAQAQSCLDQVRQLADRHGVSDNPPPATSSDSGPTTTEKLARSGGVIEPPPTSDKSVIAPRDTQAYRMPTVPDVTPRDSAKDKGADLSALQATLMAARAQAERGNEQGCLEALARAKSLSARDG